jgi:site-specific recombinase XerC
MATAVVRSIGSAGRFQAPSAQVLEDFEQELVDQYCLAAVGAGLTDGYIARERAAVFRFIRHLGGRLWTATPDDADRYLVWARRDAGWAHSTIEMEAGCLSWFYEFVIDRYQGDIHGLTGHVVIQPVDEFNRPAKGYHMPVRVPPTEQEVAILFDNWRTWLPHARKFLPAARDYLAASLWRRGGLRISETVHLDIRDWRPDLGDHGKLHVRFGKGSRGRGQRRESSRRSTTSAYCLIGGCAMCGISSARTGPITMRRCCPANGGPERPAPAGVPVSTRCDPDLPSRSRAGFRRGPGV